MSKIRQSLTFLCYILLTGFFSCQEREADISDLELRDLNLEIDMEFKNTFKISSSEEISKIVNLYLDEVLFESEDIAKSGRSTGDDPNGLEFHLEGDILTVNPLNEPIGTESNCGEGWKNEGVCFNKSCVASKVEAAMASVADEEGCIMVKVIRTSTHARVCSKAC